MLFGVLASHLLVSSFYILPAGLDTDCLEHATDMILARFNPKLSMAHGAWERKEEDSPKPSSPRTHDASRDLRMPMKLLNHLHEMYKQ